MAPFCGKFVASSRRPLTKGNSTRSAATASHAEAPSSPVKPSPLIPVRNRRRDNGSGGKSDRCIGFPRVFARQRLILHCGLQINSSEALKRAAMEGGG